MASVKESPHGPYWICCYRKANGQRVQRSTKQTNKDKAWEVCLAWADAERKAGQGILTEAQARRVISEIVERTTGEPLQFYTAENWLQDWLKGKDQTKSKGTSVRYKQVIDAFIKHLDKRAKLNIAQIAPRDFQTFREKETKAGKSGKTANLAVKIVGGAFNAARRQGLITTDPAEAVELPEAVGMERGTFTPAEVKMLVDTADGEWKLLIMLAYFTGARLSDCCRMQWEGVDLTEETLTYTQTKTGAKVTAPLHPDLLARLNKLAGTDKAEVFILPHMANLRPGGRHGLSEGF